MKAFAIDDDYIRGGLQLDHYSQDDVEACACPFCGEFRPHTEIHVERGYLGVVRCNDCDLLYVNPRAKSPSENYHGDAKLFFEEARLIFSGTKMHHRDGNYEWELNEIGKHKPAGRLLDIGTNMGFFLRKAIERGYDGQGVEPSPSLSQIAQKHCGLSITNSYFEASNFKAESFDIITMIDVFEHVTNPTNLLNSARRVLADDGLLVIKVPNGNYNLLKQFLARKLGKPPTYDLWDAYEHVIHYVPETMARMASKSGFSVSSLVLPIPIHAPVWHDFVGHYYQYPSPFIMDWKRIILREIFHTIGKLEQSVGLVPKFAPDLMFLLRKTSK